MAKKKAINYKKTPFKRLKDDASQTNTWSVTESLISPLKSKVKYETDLNQKAYKTSQNPRKN